VSEVFDYFKFDVHLFPIKIALILKASNEISVSLNILIVHRTNGIKSLKYLYILKSNFDFQNPE